MPYIVIRGDVRCGTRYPTGSILPDGIGDEAMVEAGAIELVDDVPDSELDFDSMDIKALREAAKAAGINSFSKSAETLRDELRQVT